MPGPGRRFLPGVPRHPAAGRVRGTANKTTRDVREAIEFVAHGLGGAKRMLEWVREDPEHEKLFWSVMFMRLLPHRIVGKDDGAVEVDLRTPLSHEELIRRLEERGLPSFVFGCDVPELEPELLPDRDGGV